MKLLNRVLHSLLLGSLTIFTKKCITLIDSKWNTTKQTLIVSGFWISLTLLYPNSLDILLLDKSPNLLRCCRRCYFRVLWDTTLPITNLMYKYSLRSFPNASIISIFSYVQQSSFVDLMRVTFIPSIRWAPS